MLDMPIIQWYFVIDTSGSMAGESPDKSPIGELPELLRGIVAVCDRHPVLKAHLWLEVITFDDDAHVAVPGGFYEEFSKAVPSFEARGASCYGKAFTLLREELGRQESRLREVADTKEMGLMRPTVFFIADGAPYADERETDEQREQAWKALSDEAYRQRPNMLSFGIDHADRQVLEHYRCGKGGVSIVEGEPRLAMKRVIEPISHVLTDMASGTRDR